MKFWRRFFIYFSLFALAANCGAQEKQVPVVQNLLAGYLENDLNLQKSVLTAESKQLNLKKTKINSGFSISLSSGEAKITSSNDKTRISISPRVVLEAPQLNDSSFSVSMPVVIDDGEATMENGSAVVSFGIITGTSKNRKISVMESERALLDAERAVAEKALSAEKEFYDGLKKLYNYAATVLSKKADLYDDSLELKVLETQGYSKNSSSYRTKNLKVESDRRDVLEQQRLFERETVIFASKCGVTYHREKTDEKNPIHDGELAFENCIAFLPSEIPAVEIVDISDFDEENFSGLENARWNNYIGSLKRDADRDMSLYGSVGYIFGNDFLADDSSRADSDSVEGKLTWKWSGISASAGFGIPSGVTLLDGESSDKNFNPYYSFSLAIVPNDWRTSSLEKNQKAIDEKLEAIAIENARQNYETSVLSKKSAASNLKWSENSLREQFDMYSSLASDMEKWLSQGIVTENSYLDTKNNLEKVRINILVNKIEQIIYNNETKLLFVEAETQAQNGK